MQLLRIIPTPSYGRLYTPFAIPCEVNPTGVSPLIALPILLSLRIPALCTTFTTFAMSPLARNALFS